MAVDLGLPIDTNVTMGLHPQVVASLDFDDDTKGDLGQVVDAFQAAYDGIGKVALAREAASNDITLTTAAQVLQTADFADKVQASATAKFDKVAANLKSGIATIQRELTAPVQATAAHSVSAEIRQYVKSLQAQGKSPMDFVRNAIVNGDMASASAVLGAPPYLSGITPEMQESLLRMYHAKANPKSEKRQRAMQAALGLLDANAGLIFKELDKNVGYYTDPKTKRKFYPSDLRKLKQTSNKAFAQLDG